MTIKEIEERSGMTRANIRFYEAEGLISPARGANGYRDYSEADLETLARVKLLRTLHISLEDIRSLHSGARELAEVLAQQMEKLEQDSQDIEISKAVCKAIRNDGVRYNTLDAQHYLDTIVQKDAPELAMDALPIVRSPWRRFFARHFDSSIYSALWSIFRILVFNFNTRTSTGLDSLLSVAVSIVIMLFLEPFLLSRFGTTAGKWILGIHITDNGGEKLSYSEAYIRTKTVLSHGNGFSIPLYSIIRNWKSYTTCTDGGTLEWEYDSIITLRDERQWRNGALVVAWLAIFCLISLSTVMIAEMPKHRGDITVSEFPRTIIVSRTI